MTVSDIDASAHEDDENDHEEKLTQISGSNNLLVDYILWMHSQKYAVPV